MAGFVAAVGNGVSAVGKVVNKVTKSVPVLKQAKKIVDIANAPAKAISKVTARSIESIDRVTKKKYTGILAPIQKYKDEQGDEAIKEIGINTPKFLLSEAESRAQGSPAAAAAAEDIAAINDVPAPPSPESPDPETQAETVAVMDTAAEAEAAPKGRAATLLTGGLGLEEPAPVAKKTLLGRR